MTTTMQHEMKVLSYQGDTRTIWDPDNDDEVAAARRTFDSLRKRGYVAHTVTGDGTAGEVIRTFDPQAGKIIMRQPLQGG